MILSGTNSQWRCSQISHSYARLESLCGGLSATRGAEHRTDWGGAASDCQALARTALQ